MPQENSDLNKKNSPESVSQLLNSIKDEGFLTVLTGAGISAESGIPTFRGTEGYWKIGSKNYHPQEMATYSMFSQKPYEVWSWYLYRRGICNQAKPNDGHLAIVELEKILHDRFLLITQNVDGLHKNSGNKRIYEIHGNINKMRCSKECCKKIFDIPSSLQTADKKWQISEEEKKLLKCPECSSLARPHILWFDESYNETYYKFNSALEGAKKPDLLIVIGTTGATSLPFAIIKSVIMRKKPVIMIDPYPNEITHLIENYPNGYYLQNESGHILPKICKNFY